MGEKVRDRGEEKGKMGIKGYRKREGGKTKGNKDNEAKK